MKRYKEYHDFFGFEESDDGEWVKFEAIQKYVSERRGDDYRKKIRTQKDLKHLERFDIEWDYADCEMYEEAHTNGRFVYYDDIEDLLDAMKLLNVKSVECNCADNLETKPEWDYSEEKWIPHEWICPAHGYKKL